MSASATGLLMLIGSCVVWGLSPLYFKPIVEHGPAMGVGPWDLLAHRAVWSALSFALFLAVRGRIHALGEALAGPGIALRVLFATVMIAINWGLFIYALLTLRVTETALGLYVFPLVAVLLGTVYLGERLSRLQWGSVALAFTAVAFLGLALGTPPWLALIVAGTLGLYSLTKRGIPLGPTVSVTAESLIMALPALGWFAYQVGQGKPVFPADLGMTLLLVGSGVVTALPLALFTAAAKRVPMSTLGLMQFLNPTLQFVCAVAIFAEPFSMAHGITFALIWLALGLYSISGLAQDKARRKSAMTSSTEPPI